MMNEAQYLTSMLVTLQQRQMLKQASLRSLELLLFRWVDLSPDSPKDIAEVPTIAGDVARVVGVFSKPLHFQFQMPPLQILLRPTHVR